MRKIQLYILIILLAASCSKDSIFKTSLPNDLDFTGSIIGCGDFSVHQALSNSNTNIWLNISGNKRTQLGLDSNYRSFSLPADNITVSIEVYKKPAGELFCNDIIGDDPKLKSRWNAISGNVKFKVTNIDSSNSQTYYDISILLENVVIKHDEKEKDRTIESLVIENVHVGWYPG